ncbi:MAG: winged helix-turn-helix domain-containing protein [Porticoccaceae bacterium]
MDSVRNRAFRLGEWIVHPDSNEIVGGDQTFHVEPKAMQVLCCLYDAGGRVVSRDELIDTVWRGGVVTDHAVNRVIALLRKLLRDNHGNLRYIETISKKGYRLNPELFVQQSGGLRFSQLIHLRSLWWLAAGGAALALLVWLVVAVDSSNTPTTPGIEVLLASELPGIESTPALSPDERNIAFAWAVNRSNQPDIYIAELNSGQLDQYRQITDTPYWDSSPVWSPEGHRLAYIRASRQAQSCEIRLYVIPTKTDSRLGDCSYFYQIGNIRPLSWSPDGLWIAYRARESLAHSSSLALISPLTGEVRQFPAEPGMSLTGTAWHPDSTRLLITELGSRSQTRISEMDLSGQKSHLFYSHFIFGVTWIDNGKKILGSAWDNEVYAPFDQPHLFIFDHETTQRTKLDIHGHYPTASPGSNADSAMIAFEQWNRNYEIAIIDLNQEQKVKASLSGSGPDFSANSNRLAYLPESSAAEIWMTDGEGKEHSIITLPEDTLPTLIRWHPWGDKLLVIGYQRGGSSASIYIVNTQGYVESHFSTDGGEYSFATWSNDGTAIYATRKFGDIYSLVKIDVVTKIVTDIAENILGAYQGSNNELYVQSSQDLAIRQLSSSGELSAPVVQKNPLSVWDWGVTPNNKIFHVERSNSEIIVHLTDAGSVDTRVLTRLAARGTVGFGVSYSAGRNDLFLSVASIEESRFVVAELEYFNHHEE